jgi:uncharacterized membrane protein
MGGMMSLYGEFALMVVALVLLVVIAVFVGHLINLIRGRFSRSRGTASSQTADRRSSSH